jgi:hypothetical protein
MELSKCQPIPELPSRLKETLLFIACYFKRNKRYPTQFEIARGIGLSIGTNTAAGYVDPLVRKGFLIKDNACGKRKIRLTAMADSILSEQEMKHYETGQCEDGVQ